LRIEQDRVQPQAAGARRPMLAGGVSAKAGEFVPGFSAVGGLEDRRIFDACVGGVGIFIRRLDVPDALEDPGLLRAVVKLMGGERSAAFLGIFVVDELVAFALGHSAFAGEFLRFAAGRVPGLAAVVGALNDLSEPAAGLRAVDAVGILGRALE